MKRDMDLVRAILIAIEEQSPSRSIIKIDLDNYNREQIGYHLVLLYKANLIEGVPFAGSNQESVTPTGLTWSGHDFLANARNDNVWNKVKEIVTNKGGDISFDVLKGLLATVAAQFFGLTP